MDGKAVVGQGSGILDWISCSIVFNVLFFSDWRDFGARSLRQLLGGDSMCNLETNRKLIT